MDDPVIVRAVFSMPEIELTKKFLAPSPMMAITLKEKGDVAFSFQRARNSNQALKTRNEGQQREHKEKCKCTVVQCIGKCGKGNVRIRVDQY